MRKPYVSPRAFSKDGYLIDQRLLKNLPYGIRQSDYNGCGWIAAYNFLHALGRKKEYDTVRMQLEDSLMMGGLLGTHLLQLYLYLRKHGFPLQWAFGRKSAVKKAQQCKAGILFYCNGAALHFVTFIPATAEERAAMADKEEDIPVDAEASCLYRFFNGRMGCQNDIDTLTHFLERESITPVLVQLTTR